ncbi:uncharacterized protein LOC142544606 [Primulina tabacum]|uniref:uncharacterized protein LOC142544606 n=1 Tax=Primulina tabacum TaxID=48773 RepID=UPI003F5A6D9C
MEKKTKKKHLSSIANDVIQRCALTLDSLVYTLVEDFERDQWKPEMGAYSRKLIEFCCSKALTVLCGSVDEKIIDGSISRFTFDMMLAWEIPSSAEEESHTECVAKEREEKKVPIVADQVQDDIPLFYSDLMPLLVDSEPSAGEDAFVWLGTLVPLLADVINGRFTFETLTATTGNRLHFPAYDKFLREIHKCIKHLQKQDIPKGVELVDDEFILHVEGTASSQRVVRHIGGSSWPGRLTLTNYALYFEASGVISYDDSLKLDLSKDIGQNVISSATGPWGSPIFDKAVVYESLDLQEGVVLEFPEMTSSTRRDHWLALVKEVILLHRFLSKFELESPLEAWEMHARTILGIIRLHAAREMLRISPPVPNRFLIFTLLDEVPKGDYVLDELAESLKKVTSGHPCSASSILRNLNTSRPPIYPIPCAGMPQVDEVSEMVRPENLSSLESALHRAREEAKEVDMAKATTEGLKEEGISESAQVLIGLLKPVKSVLPWSREVISWERPATTWIVVITTIIIVYKVWVGKAISAFLLWAVAKMVWTRRWGIPEKQDKIVIRTGSDQTTMESIVSAQHGLNSLHEMMQQVNIALLKIWSVLVSRTPKHTNTVMIVMTGSALVLAVVPIKFILMTIVLHGFMVNSKFGKHFQNEQGNRRLREWWDSIPVIPVEVVDKDK